MFSIVHNKKKTKIRKFSNRTNQHDIGFWIFFLTHTLTSIKVTLTRLVN